MGSNRLFATLAWLVAGVGIVAGAVNSALDLAQRDELTAGAGLLFKYYIQVTGWLSTKFTVPAWALLLLLALGVGAIRLILRQRSQLTDLSKALDAAATPLTPELDSIDERVLFWVRHIYDSSSTGLGPTPAIVAHLADMPLSSVEASVDALKQAGLIRLKKLKRDPLDLTPQGREYFKSLEVRSRYDTFQLNLLRRRI